ncbi:Heat shock 70 kDa protein 12A [Mizuhopecten yessoensis]|uniref:Heat shock 70 kDa protein n=1 Tax=Mizuhopecten yessoensis TaxID=6573 RepID=A0A1C9U2Y7_MIZYE|nr:heat shock 70 kDa protein [Mizuhopecten yessoensis]OWF47855.1 Heat shock 70 kDa protein 12A [Mizuhopecten yessoensis]
MKIRSDVENTRWKGNVCNKGYISCDRLPEGPHDGNDKKNRAVDVPESEIRWVVTVPAIWTDPAKQMMREAAEKAGIARNQLILALEPETASMLCKHLPAFHLLSGDRTDKVETFRSGSKYIVFDSGEIHAANGGDWGGTKVDEALEELLESIVGKAAFEHFRANEIPSIIDLHRNFEVKKKTFTGKDVGTKTTLTVPHSLLELFTAYNPGKPIAYAIEMNHCSTDVEWKHDKVRLSQNKTLSLFEQSFKHITDHMSDILSKPEVKDCEAILMVGGYSECPLLQDAIRNVAGDICLIIPCDASLAVLKGAMINGHCPNTVSERICKYTYGVCSRFSFGRDECDKYRLVDEDGVVMCANCFSILAKRGSPVKIGESSITRSFTVGYSGAKYITFIMYASIAASPRYVTDDSCQKIGQMTLLMPDTSLGNDRGANVTMYFGGSEIELTAVDKHTGRKISACFDFLG